MGGGCSARQNDGASGHADGRVLAFALTASVEHRNHVLELRQQVQQLRRRLEDERLRNERAESERDGALDRVEALEARLTNSDGQTIGWPDSQERKRTSGRAEEPIWMGKADEVGHECGGAGRQSRVVPVRRTDNWMARQTVEDRTPVRMESSRLDTGTEEKGPMGSWNDAVGVAFTKAGADCPRQGVALLDGLTGIGHAQARNGRRRRGPLARRGRFAGGQAQGGAGGERRGALGARGGDEVVSAARHHVLRAPGASI
jgi:hypothetical protein